jgi:hypothetical protein
MAAGGVVIAAEQSLGLVPALGIAWVVFAGYKVHERRERIKEARRARAGRRGER